MSGGSRHKSSPEPNFDVKIVGGKRVIIWRPNSSQRPGNLYRNRSFSASALDHISDHYLHRPLILPPIQQTENNLDSNQVYEIKLWRELFSLLRNYEEKELKNILDELTKKDSEKQKTTTPETIISVATQYKLPVPLYLLKILCERFAIRLNPIGVQFENLLNYLINCKSQPPPTSDLAQTITTQSVKTESKTTQSRTAESITTESVMTQSVITKTQKLDPIQKNNDYSTAHLSVQDEARVINQLKKELVGNDIQLDIFHRHANELDIGRKGALSKQQIEKLLRLNNIKIPENLLLKILAFCYKQGYRLYDLKEFLSFFERAKAQTSQRSIEPHTPDILIEPLQFINNIQPGPFSLTRHFPSPVSLSQEEWISNYNLMVSALKTSCQDQKGYMSINEVYHIIDHYNVVYNLQLDAQNVKKSLDYIDRNFPGFVSIEPFSNHLRELHLKQHYRNKLQPKNM